MKILKNENLYKFFNILNKKRKKQVYLLIILLILNGILESFSVASVVPLLSVIASLNNQSKDTIFSKYIAFFEFNDAFTILLIFTILFCFLIVSSTCLRIFNISFIARLSAKINIDISALIYKNNIYQPYHQYTKKDSSKLISLALDKVELAASAINSLLTVLASSIISISIIISLFVIKWQIISIGLAFIFIYYFLIYSKFKKILINNGEITARLIPLRLKIIKESLDGFRDVIINNSQKICINLFNEYNSVIKLKRANSELLVSIPRILIEGIALLLITIIAYFIFSSESNPTYIIPYIASFIYAFQKLLPLIQQIYSALGNFQFKSAVIRDIVEDLERGYNNEKIFLFKKDIKFKKDIVFENIYFDYEDSKNILNDLNFQINKGDLIGIYGKTGSGKSTLLDLLMGLLIPKKGRILIDNFDVYKNDSSASWISNIAHVPQSIFLKEGSIEENIAFGEHISMINFELLIKASKVAHIYDFILGLDKGFKTKVGDRGILLSGGQRQRIAIARAIYQSKSILVLDEATSALDDITEKNILNSILEMKDNFTVIMVTHRIRTLKKCNRIFKVINKTVIEEK